MRVFAVILDNLVLIVEFITGIGTLIVGVAMSVTFRGMKKERYQLNKAIHKTEDEICLHLGKSGAVRSTHLVKHFQPATGP